MPLKRLLSALFLLLALPALGQERSLHWDEIVVNAHLDARGTLHVRERQTFVFTGPWNGGERSFRVGLNQDLELEGLYRVGPDGREIPLVEGDVGQVDHYAWADKDTLRWRSRLESDPPFDGTVMTYVIAYSLSRILTREGDVWSLSHDFSLPEAEWPIENLVVDLDLDPSWQPLDGTPTRFTRRHLQGGESVIVRTRLRHTGGTGAMAAEAGATLPPAPLRRGLFAATLVIMAALYVRFRKAEAGRGRFEPLPQAVWEETWLQENVFDLKPEEVGALWDQTVGPPEVAAVLARMVAEKKMTSEVRPGMKILGWQVKPGVLHLRLTVPRNSLPGYERGLVDKLFFDGDDTDTDRVKKHYRSTGFNPATVIEKPLRALLAKHGQLGEVPAPDRKPTLLLWLAVAVLFALNAVSSLIATAVLAAVILFLALWPTLLGMVAAFAWRKRTAHLDLASLTFLIPGLIVLGICAAAAFLREWAPASDVPPGLFATMALAVLPLAVWNSLLNNARSRESDGTIRKRRLLASARSLLAEELESANPRLRDEWLPYLLAFGLGTNVDRWFRSFGGATGRSMSTMGSGGSGGGIGGSGSGGGWSGGGGSFGGAGATGAWAVAATGLASGVSAPSSSGGGGGGGGGSSSGGGGGGGW